MTQTASRGKKLAIAKGLRFDCRQCGDCCRDFPVALSDAEIERLDGVDWTPILGEHGLHVWESASLAGTRGRYLKRRADGACLFLGQDSLCEIHRHHGEAFKPLACRMFPFHFVAGPPQAPPTATAYFACSSVAAGEGKPLAQRRKDLEALLAELEQADARPELREDPVPWEKGVAWARADVELLMDLMVRELERADLPLAQRLVAVTEFVSLVAASRFGEIGDPKRQRLIETFAAGVHDQAARGLLQARMVRPPLPERLIFRQILGMSARRDPATLLTAGTLRRLVRRFGNLISGMAFTAGSGGFVPVGRERRVNVVEVRRKAPPADPAIPIADGMLTRYFVGQLSGGVLFSPSFQVRELLAGLGLLLRQYPAIVLFARAACLARGGDELTRDDYAAGIRTADWNFGRVPWTTGMLGGIRASFLGDVKLIFGHLPWCAEQPKVKA